MKSQGIALRHVLIASMLLFSLLPAAIVGALLHRSSSNSVHELANKIIADVAQGVRTDTENQINQAHLIFNGLLPENPSAVQTQAALGWIADPLRFEEMAVSLSRMSPNAPFWYLGTADGGFYGVTTDPLNVGGRLTVRVQKPGEDRRSFYLATAAGDRSWPLPTEAKPFDARVRPWYQAATAARVRGFTPVYLSASEKKLIVTLAQPVLDANNAVAGVFAADIFLDKINDLLWSQNISRRGQAFLLDDQGLLVASSARDALFTETGGKLERIKPDTSSDTVIRQSYAAVAAKLGALTAGLEPRNPFSSQAPLDSNERLDIQVHPFGDHLGLKWTLVVAVPEGDFAGQTQQALKHATWVMLAVMVAGALLAGVFAHRLSLRFARLREAADVLGSGEVPVAQDSAYISDVRVLARALHDSGRSLHDARADIVAKAIALQEANEQLEARVERRTAQLSASREEALQAAKAKAAFLATMSHEIRTPLNGVVGMTGLLADTPLNEEQRDYLHTMRVSSDQLLGVINDILDFSKIESGKLDLENEPLNLQSAIEEACDIAAPRAREKRLELLVDHGEGVPAWVRGDVTRLRQVLLNFINNAVKFTEQGEIVVSSRVLQDFDSARVDAPGALIEFRVKDSGIGIPPERIGALFQSFTQVDASTTRKYGGTGLGLAICKRLAQIMGGDVGVESQSGQGSTFWFTARLSYADTPEYSESSIKQLTSLRDRRVLVVDDTHLNLRILAKQLGGWSMQVQTFDQPQLALEWLQNQSVDVIVTDMHMPGMDGMDFSRALRKLHADSARTVPPVLLLTSGVLPTGADAKLFDARMFKPYRQNQLFESLARLMVSPGSAATNKQAAPTVQKNLCILVVDDNAVNLKVALAMLTKLGYDAVTAADGQQAVQRLDESFAPGGQRFAAVLMDANMPVMDGYEASRAIIQQHQHAAPPIIALTASVLEEDRKRALDAGMVGFLPKPLRIDELTQALSQWTVEKAPVQGSEAAVTAMHSVAGHAENMGAGGQISVENPTPADIKLNMDWSRLEQFKEFDDDELTMTREVINLFVADLPQRLTDLDSALTAQDAAALARAAHALKGAASNVGALSVSDRCGLLEQQAKLGAVPPEADAQVAAIRLAGLATLQALQDWAPTGA